MLENLSILDSALSGAKWLRKMSLNNVTPSPFELAKEVNTSSFCCTVIMINTMKAISLLVNSSFHDTSLSWTMKTPSEKFLLFPCLFQLFIAQYHIWLAHDTKGILVLIPDQPLLNVTLTTYVFVCICHEIHKVSGVLANSLITKDVTTMLRRFAVFVFMLIIIWWHKTHQIPKPKLHVA